MQGSHGALYHRDPGPADFSSPTGFPRTEWSPHSQITTPVRSQTLSFSAGNNARTMNRLSLEHGTPGPGAFVIQEETERPGPNRQPRQTNRSRDRHDSIRARPPVDRHIRRNLTSSYPQNDDHYRHQVLPPYFAGASSAPYGIQEIHIITTPQRPFHQRSLVAPVPCPEQIGVTSSYGPPGRLAPPELSLQVSPANRRRSLPSTSTSTSATNSKGRKKSWWVINCFAEASDENMQKIYVCLACKGTRSGKLSASRLADHLWKCRNVSEKLKERLFEDCQHIRTVVRTYSSDHPGNKRDNHAVDRSVPSQKRRKGNGPFQTFVGECSASEGDEISMKLVRATVEFCLPLTIFDSPSSGVNSFREAFLSARPGYRDMYPSRHSVMVKFLPKLYNQTYSVVKKCLKQILSNGYGTVIFDGWDDINRSSVVNLLLRVESKSARKCFFLDSVYTGHARVGATEYVKIIEKVMNDFGGLKRVCGVTSDSARACVNARDALARKYPGLIGLQDQAHVADLLMKDIGKLAFVREVLDQVNMLVVETRGKKKLLSFVRDEIKKENKRVSLEEEQETEITEAARSLPVDPMHPDRLFPPLRKTAIMLRKPSATRFASISDTLEAFIRSRDVLCKVIMNPQFDRHLFTTDKPEQDARREQYKDLVSSVSFLERVKEIHKVFRLCRRYLRIFDKETGTSVADVVPCTETLGEALSRVPTSSEYLTQERLALIQSRFKRRKDGPITGRGIQVRLVEDVHIAAYMLHPTRFPHDYERYSQRFYAFIKRFVHSTVRSQDQEEENESNLNAQRVSLINKIMNDYEGIHSRWIAARDDCGTPRGEQAQLHYELAFRTEPLRFWIEESRLGLYPELCELALRTLSISPSSCSAERTFSVQGRIRTKLRNRLDENVVRKMMFVKWNIKHYDESVRNAYRKQKRGSAERISSAKDWLYCDGEEISSDSSDSEDLRQEEELDLVGDDEVTQVEPASREISLS